MEVLGAFFDSLSLGTLYECELLLKEKIKVLKVEHRNKVKTAMISQYFESCDKFIQEDDVLFSGVSAEVMDMDLKAVAGKPTNLWLTSDNESYTFSNGKGKSTVNPPCDINKFNCIKQLMQKINKDYDCDMNSCLVTFYPDGKSGIGYHCDDEQEIDSHSPICVFSIGAERTVDLINSYQQSYEDPLLSYTTKSGSLYLMKAGCQSLFRHRVKSVRTQCAERYCLSFRKKVPKTPLKLTSPVKSLVAKYEKIKSDTLLSDIPIKFVKAGTDEVTNMIPRKSTGAKRKTTTVLFGTSQTTRLKSSGIGKRGRKFINQSMSGAKICDISEMVDVFHGTNPAADDVEKVILSFGANDIKHEHYGLNGRRAPRHVLDNKARNGVKKFRQPVVDLVKKVKQLFPGACVVLQSVLPMKRLYWYTAGNVLGFNDILMEVSRSYDCYYLNCFRDFLSKDGMEFNRQLFFDWLHPNVWGCNILSKYYSYVTNSNSNSFNMIIGNIFSDY